VLFADLLKIARPDWLWDMTPGQLYESIQYLDQRIKAGPLSF
jgi:hypothetical protein